MTAPGHERTDRKMIAYLITRFEQLRASDAQRFAVRDLSPRQIQIIEEALKGQLYAMARQGTTWVLQ